MSRFSGYNELFGVSDADAISSGFAFAGLAGLVTSLCMAVGVRRLKRAERVTGVVRDFSLNCLTPKTYQTLLIIDVELSDGTIKTFTDSRDFGMRLFTIGQFVPVLHHVKSGLLFLDIDEKYIESTQKFAIKIFLGSAISLALGVIAFYRLL